MGNKIANRITKALKGLPQKHLQNGHDKEIPKERYISPKERQRIIDELRLI